MWMTTTWNAKYYSNIYSKSSQSFCDEYNGMIIKVVAQNMPHEEDFDDNNYESIDETAI